MPPLRNAPTGTSLTMCRRSASSIRASSSSSRDSSDPVELRRLREVPVLTHDRRRVAFERQKTAGRQLVYPFEHRKRRVDEPQRQILIERGEIHPPGAAGSPRAAP